MSIEKEQAEHIRGIVTSLFYLAKNAEQNGLTDIAKMLRVTISRIDDGPPRKKADLDSLMANESVFHILEFINSFSRANEETRREFLEIVGTIDRARELSGRREPGARTAKGKPA